MGDVNQRQWFEDRGVDPATVLDGSVAVDGEGIMTWQSALILGRLDINSWNEATVRDNMEATA